MVAVDRAGTATAGYATLAADKAGVTPETYSRYGLLGVFGLAGLATARATVAPGAPRAQARGRGR